MGSAFDDENSNNSLGGLGEEYLNAAVTEILGKIISVNRNNELSGKMTGELIPVHNSNEVVMGRQVNYTTNIAVMVWNPSAVYDVEIVGCILHTKFSSELIVATGDDLDGFTERTPNTLRKDLNSPASVAEYYENVDPGSLPSNIQQTGVYNQDSLSNIIDQAEGIVLHQNQGCLLYFAGTGTNPRFRPSFTVIDRPVSA